MIVEWALKVLGLVLRGIGALIPDGSAPEWFTGFAGSLGTLLGTVSTVGAWVPIPLAVSVFTALLACIVTGFGIRVTRIVISFLTAGGGSAG